MQFIPEVNGHKMAPLEFTNIIYVPSLSTNLFSVLYLTIHRHFTVSIKLDTLHFIEMVKLSLRQRSPLPMLHTSLETIPVENLPHFHPLQPPSMDLTLLHRRLCHSHLAGIKKLFSGNLVTGFKLDSQADPDPVCEACKAGKMHADPFPNSTSRASKPLQLVHSDVHGPVKVPTHSGYHYSVTFIDDFSRFKAVYLLKRKSETFAAFKQFKAWAENVTGAKGWAPCAMTRVGSTCQPSLRHSALTMASRGSTLSGIALSRMVWQRGATGQWRKASSPCSMSLGCLQPSGERPWPLSFMSATG